MTVSEKEKSYLEGSLMPQAKFLQESYTLAVNRYQWVKRYAKNKVVLDAGCGSGYGADGLIRSGAKKVYGVDINSESIKYCQEHHQQENLEFSIGDLAKLDLPDKSFDLIVAFEVIEHVKDCPKVISEFYRLLKPGGKLILSTPNKKIYSPGTKKSFYPFHWQEFYLEDLKKLLSRFQSLDIFGQFIKGKKMLLYPVWHPKRIIRIIYANLPFIIKIIIMRWYLRTYFWIYRKGIYHPKEIKLSDVYFSKDVNKTRIFVAICQKNKSGKLMKC